ncbi:MAG: hypothetical protein K7J46_11455 [Bryobacter sp.]|jgi:Flp pilus assembly pilin Flp|nr:hypothetical protein [Bryobacter sp. CoA8 C33]
MPRLNFKSIGQGLRGLWADSSGQDLIEYALLSSFMVVAIWIFFPTGMVVAISGIFSRLLSTASILVP